MGTRVAIYARVSTLNHSQDPAMQTREIEEYLFRHPAVADVQVFGVPDKKYGEELCAWIVRKPGCETTEEEIRRFCQGQISHQKIPRYMRFVDAFPITASGKARKSEMRKAE